MNSPRIGSLCTGYGGLDDAVQRVFGGSTAWVSDIDPGACRILAHRMPGIPNLGDLTTTDWDQVEPVDIVTGGYPCQPFSSAGKRKGTEDERHIWPYIADALGVLRPRVAIFENVSGHLRLGFDTVLADLARLGFDVEWACVRASEVGAPHPRQRLFIYATAQDADREPRHQRRIAASGQAQGGRARADAGRRGGTPAADADRSCARPELDSEPATRQSASLRNHAGRPGVQRAAAADAACVGHGDAWPAGERGLEAAAVASRAADSDWGRFAPAVARWEAVTGRHAPWATDDRNRLSPAFVEWLMGLPAGHVTEVPDLTRTQQLKALGNGVVPQQAEAAIRLLADRAATAPAALHRLTPAA